MLPWAHTDVAANMAAVKSEYLIFFYLYFVSDPAEVRYSNMCLIYSYFPWRRD